MMRTTTIHKDVAYDIAYGVPPEGFETKVVDIERV